jgi:energy-converting hydrogenase A subunit M
MHVRLINTDNDEIVDLINKKGDLSFDDEKHAEFHDLSIGIVDRKQKGNVLTLHSPWYFYKFAIL